MLRLSFRLPNLIRLRPYLFSLVPLAILHVLAWYIRGTIIDGETIARTLSAITVLNLILVGLLLTRFYRFALLSLAATYFLHFLYFLLSYFERRAI